MTDELDPITPPAEPTAPAAVAEPPAPPPDPDEAQAIEVQGGKMVPLAALKAAREEAKVGKEASARVQALEAELARAKPYQQFIEANPQLLHREQPAPPPQSPDADPELVELARAMDYYKADGSPDLARAKTYDGLLTARATKIAQRMVQPVAQAGYQQQSNANWGAVTQAKLPNGQAIDTTILGEMWKHLPVEQTADPRVAALVRDLTIAEQGRRSPLPQSPPPPNAPPVHTDNVGSLPRPAVRLSLIEQKIAAERGMTTEKYQKLTSDFTPGRMNPLED